ncbi:MULTISPECIES: TRAP transporter small permease subunit [unclassified Hyphomonas]|jgi:TRAP-type mannitol/chloroaromatic compound transport system permease small subunit|uniref:Tripartite ATP-independent periplasmic transporters DctQ component domain-containing protein n=1 Tax=hydrothermal vent metagenome TaxID=652676 RepID=A0A160U0Z6_9ZZZZ|nr:MULTISPECIES: TRAP transporter small permease subunit [unclassified Hyphomonas]MAN89636.1 TRAP transporter permease DctQ [Hyphomonadaceae bacterium]MAA81913.1 TRAP transporter permease DctQ [Hyphomonas sp.]MBG66904.1 TRAP transporter permease DctQ [Hyphomonas sp.]MBO6582730.1 TRAP transporter small permease subunit [Hyphomonas sp.]MDF1805055.1 TRAP transporter small permease subunit [Hyphomonas sp.]|tara:strand:- start:9485 stop:10150 length:666 start_codon:yes stop_codon:yes gene_type:complete
MSPEIFLTLGGALKWLGLALSPLLLLPLIVTIWPDPVERIAKWLSARIDAVSGWALGGAIAGAIILVGAQLLVVLLRYAFGLSFTWLNEIVIYAFAAMFMLGSASALRDDAHVRVDILRPRFGARRRNWIELAGIYLFLFPICIRLLAMTEQGLARSWALFEGSRESDGLPLLFLFKTLLPAFAVLMLVQGLSEALKAALRLTGKLDDVAEEEPHGGVHGT